MANYVQSNTSQATEKLDKANTWVISKIRSTMQTRGFLKNLVGISKMFKELDEDGTMELDFDEFKTGMNHYCGLSLTFDEAKMAFALFDTNGDSKVSIDEFLFAVLPPLTPNRTKYVKMTFQSFHPSMKKHNHVEELTIDVEDIYNRINMKYHPCVQFGTRSAMQMFREFLNGFEGDVGKDVDFREFTQYATTLSSMVETDYEFGHMLVEMFQVPDVALQQLSDENQRATAITGNSGKVHVVQVHEGVDQLWADHSRATLGGTVHEYSGAVGRLRRQMRE